MTVQFYWCMFCPKVCITKSAGLNGKQRTWNQFLNTERSSQLQGQRCKKMMKYCHDERYFWKWSHSTMTSVHLGQSSIPHETWSTGCVQLMPGNMWCVFGQISLSLDTSYTIRTLTSSPGKLCKQGGLQMQKSGCAWDS